MSFIIHAACISSRGRIRRNNEDNYLFDGRCLPAIHDEATPLIRLEQASDAPIFAAVFDGMGGESFGELASYAAAERMRAVLADAPPFGAARVFLEELCLELNRAVVEKKEELLTSSMGTTAVIVCFSGASATVCNVGDSRCYLLRGGVLRQLSVDHVEAPSPVFHSKKPPLSQSLGIPEDDFLIEPHTDSVSLAHGDLFLLCSDGITDMLTDEQIASVLNGHPSPADSALVLLQSAMENGGRDNITAIVCAVEQAEETAD